MQEENINLSEIFDALKKRFKMILCIIGMCLVTAGILSFFVITPKYEAKVKVFVGKEENKNNAGYDNSEIQMYQKLLSTYSEIIKTEDLVEDALQKGGINLEAKDVLKALVVTPRNDTQIIEIGYQDTDKNRVVEVTKAITEEFIKESKELIPNGKIQIIEEARVPKNPVSPNKTMNMLIALVLGLMIGIGITLLLEFLDNTVKSKDELEKLLEIPTIGAIPEFDEEVGRKGKKNKKGAH